MKRALLIASNLHKRLGIAADLRCMTEVFEAYDFDEIEPMPRPATRERILGALEALALRCDPGDTVVIYYTGHGGLARFDGEVAGLAEPDRVWRYLVPEDPERHSISEGRFAGVLDVEIGHILAPKLAHAHVTLILECCYAGGMFAPPDVRLDDGAKSRGIAPPVFPVPAWLKKPGQAWATPSEGRPALGSAPIIVAATSEARKSYESAQDGSAADFTKALSAALLRHRDQAITWGRLIDGVRSEVQVGGQRLSQAPHVIGPRGRRVFGSETSDISREYQVIVGEDRRLRLIAGGVHGLHEDDELELVDPETELALSEARAIDLDETRAWLEPTDCSAIKALEPGTSLVATLRTSAAPTPVQIVGQSPTLTELGAELVASPWLRVAEAETEAPFRVKVDAGRVLLEAEKLRRNPVPADPREDLAGDLASPATWMARELEALARARRFAEVCARARPIPKTFSFSLLADGEPLESGATITRSQALSLNIHYYVPYTGETQFLNIVNIGLDGLPYLVNDAVHNAGGLAIYSQERGHSRTLWTAGELSWTERVPRTPSFEALVLVLTSRELDLRPLTRSAEDPRPRTPARRELPIVERMTAPVELWAERIDFILQP